MKISAETLIAADGSSDVAAHFDADDAATRDQVMHLLTPTTSARAGRICLIGLRGAAKSTLGKMAAVALGMPFVEINTEIAAKAGIPIAEFMALYGHR